MSDPYADLPPEYLEAMGLPSPGGDVDSTAQQDQSEFSGSESYEDWQREASGPTITFTLYGDS
ncbi:hypothetical protein HLB23_29625 [Nocardia uniformis]|uniref:Uncharacterized protein n=1 Tax=Nocardia uniformis TaxID=53432 RepID=A0A849CCA1_9NOCA|nr:hypothetical protein [Nocardia uniformis]NNH73965.1 hypothetical protein [Nocardia uniformis]